METALTTIAGYALKMAATLSLLYIPYIFLLRRETHFGTSRTTLLAVLILSVAIPFIDIPQLHIDLAMPFELPAQGIETAVAGMPASVVENGEYISATVQDGISVKRLLYYALIVPYILVALIITLARIYQIARIRASIAKGTLWIEEKKEYTIHCHADATPPYSWMRHIVISQDDYNRYGKEIVLHEEGHITRRHSWDMLLLTAVETIQWFNPFVHMLGNDLKDVHEYEADAYVLQRTENTKEYQMLIIKKAVDHASYTLANSFNHSNLKKRITMMLKKKSNPWRGATALYLLPATALALGLFASPQKATGTESIEPTTVAYGKVSETAEINDTIQEQIYQVVENMPEFPGGMTGLMKYLRDNIKYPDEARKQNKQGRCFVRFVVETDGSISDVTIQVSAGDESLDKESMRVVSAMPKWKPGTQRGEAVRVQFTLPVTYRLDPATQTNSDASDKAAQAPESEDKEKIYTVVENMPQYPGGIEAVMKYLGKENKHISADDNKEGKIIATMVIEPDGRVNLVSVAGKDKNSIDKEAIRKLYGMPKWKPGTQGGKAVRTRITLPIDFSL